MYLNKTVFLVAGISRSGIAATEFLLSHGAECFICDEMDTEGIRTSTAMLSAKGARPISGDEAVEAMDKIDVLKIIRANDEKFKKHIEKIHQLEEREKKLNLNDLIKQNEDLKKKTSRITKL